MKPILWRYVLGETLVAGFMAAVATVVLLLVGNTLKLLGKQVSILVIASALPYILLSLVVFVVPMAMLVGTVLVFGRMAMENELLAMSASGVPLRTVAAPVLAVGVCLAALMLPINFNVAPRLDYKADAIVKTSVLARGLRLEDRYQPSIIFPTCRIFIGRREGKVLEDVFLWRTVGGKAVQLVAADSAVISRDGSGKEVVVELKEGTAYYLGDGIENLKGPMEFSSMEIRVPLPASPKYERGLGHMTLAELIARRRNSSTPGWIKERITAEIHERAATAVAVAALLFIGIPAGASFAAGGFTAALGLSMGILFVLYYPLFILGKILSRAEILPAYLSLWIPDAVVVVLGLILMKRKRL